VFVLCWYIDSLYKIQRCDMRRECWLTEARNFKQDRKCTYNATLRSFRESLLPWKSNTCYMCVCVCVRARSRTWERVGCPGEWACSCACARVALLIQYAMCMRHIMKCFVAFLAPPHFSTLSHGRRDFRKKISEHKTCVLILSKAFLWNSDILSQMCKRLNVKYPLFYVGS
jgi:hypothetical protein